jgi:uncharacterized protein DUF6702
MRVKMPVAIARRLRAAAGAAVLGVMCSGAAAHPLHTTITELTVDGRTHVVTISIRTFADDFGTTVARRAGIPVPRDHAVPDSAVSSYLTKTFSILDASGRPLRLTWVGARREAEVLWITLQATAPSGFAGLQVRATMLFDTFEDQVNIVQAKTGDSRKSLLFTRGDGAKRL